MRARERKPPWLRELFPDNNPAKLVARKCDGCGLYVIEDRTDMWSKWDYGLVAGDDITVAVILDRRLARLEWPYGSVTPRLHSTLADIGIHADGQYLAGHDCGQARVSTLRIPKPARPRPAGKPWGHDIPSDQDINEFERVWHLPYTQLTGVPQ